MQRIARLSSWKRHKYNARGGRCQKGHSHRSGLELRVCNELMMREKAKDIASYEVEKRIVLIGPSGKSLGKEIWVDFEVTHNDGTIEYVEAKGMVLEPWPLKWLILQDMKPDARFTVVKR